MAGKDFTDGSMPADRTVGKTATVIMRWLKSFVELFFPRQCVVCGAILHDGEEVLCLGCNIGMPRTDYHLQADNLVERSLWGKVPLQRATSYIYYRKGDEYRRILHLLKYEGRSDVGETMGRFIATDLLRYGFFDGVDIIVPVPLHPDKLKSRGYNQSECIAKGISSVVSIPVDTVSLLRQKSNETQTRKSAFGRWENVEGIFKLHSAGAFAGKHILLVDDVLTTGATITACADALAGVENVRISVLTLAVAE